MPYPSSSARNRYGDRAANDAATGTVTATPSTHSIPASAGPAPPRRDSSGSSVRRPTLCRSASSAVSCGVSGAASAELVPIARLEVRIEHVCLQVLADRCPLDLVVLAQEVAPRLVGGEQDAVRADPAALDLGQQPAWAESDCPGGIGVDLVALLHPVQEPRYQLDVPADPAAEMDQVDLDSLAVPLHQRDEVIEVRRTAGAGVEVEHQVMRLGGGEAGPGDLGGRL